jgi:DNA-binding transcriptional LysR family regulator
VDQLAAIRAFVRIVETGSFTQAAASLGMPKATVTKLIQSLESHLRTPLLNRTTRRLAVTVDGAAYYERAIRLLADLEERDGTVTASQARPTGRLRIDVSVPLAQHVIIPALAGFYERYPDIQLDMGVSDRQTDMVAENVDCVIRGGELADQALIARRIAELHMITCATPHYLHRHGTPRQPAELQLTHCVVNYFSANTGRARPFRFRREAEVLEVMGRYRTAVNEVSTYLAAGLASHGIIQVPHFLVRDHLQAGTLRQVLHEWTTPSIPLHVVYPPNRHVSNKLRVFVDWVAGLFAAAQFDPIAAPRKPGSSVP